MVQVDPKGMSLEYCGTLRDLTEDDATMPERFTVPRAALEYGNETDYGAAHAARAARNSVEAATAVSARPTLATLSGVGTRALALPWPLLAGVGSRRNSLP